MLTAPAPHPAPRCANCARPCIALQQRTVVVRASHPHPRPPPPLSVHSASASGDHAAAVARVVSGALALLKHSEVAAAADLCELLLQILDAGDVRATSSTLPALIEVAAAFPAGDAQVDFLKKLLAWSAGGGPASAGAAALHHALARAYRAAGQLGNASHHMQWAPQTDSAWAEHATTLLDWARAGYTSETPLFIVRAVLQLAGLTNLRGASAVYRAALAELEAPGNSRLAAVTRDDPLLHFTDFLLQTLERDASLPLFKLLVRKCVCAFVLFQLFCFNCFVSIVLFQLFCSCSRSRSRSRDAAACRRAHSPRSRGRLLHVDYCTH